MKRGPIVIIEDDGDDKEMLEEAMREIGIKNEIIWFTNCIESFQYLKETPKQPFLIFCDINLPRQTGMEFKRQIDEDPELRKKSIPFIFHSTADDQKTVNEAFTEMTVQGFFKKASSFSEMKDQMKTITDYWLCCKHPNIF